MRTLANTCLVITFIAGFLIFDSVVRLGGNIPYWAFLFYIGLLVTGASFYFLFSRILAAEDEGEDQL